MKFLHTATALNTIPERLDLNIISNHHSTREMLRKEIAQRSIFSALAAHKSNDDDDDDNLEDEDAPQMRVDDFIIAFLPPDVSRCLLGRVGRGVSVAAHHNNFAFTHRTAPRKNSVVNKWREHAIDDPLKRLRVRELWLTDREIDLIRNTDPKISSKRKAPKPCPISMKLAKCTSVRENLKHRRPSPRAM